MENRRANGSALYREEYYLTDQNESKANKYKISTHSKSTINVNYKYKFKGIWFIN